MLTLPSYLAGTATTSQRWLDVFNPFTDQQVGRVACIAREQVDELVGLHTAPHPGLSRYERSHILNRTRELIDQRRDELSRLITTEAGLCVRETRYEVGRACDVFAFAAMEALRDDGQIFSCDISPIGKPRKIFTVASRCPWCWPSRPSIIRSTRSPTNWHRLSRPAPRSFSSPRKRLRWWPRG